MVSHLYSIKFYKSSFELDNDYEGLSEHEKERISDMEADTYFDYDDDNGKYICYIISTQHEIDRYLRILKSNLIDFRCLDISNDVLKSKTNLLEDLKPMVTGTTSIKYNFFVKDINDWILDNLDIDDVLDRISDVGIESLTSIEKEFLKIYHD